MSKRKTKYCASWKKEVVTNEDVIEELYDWITPIFGDPFKVRCSLCIKSKPFTISSGGIADCKQHLKGKTHMLIIKGRSSQETLLSTFSSNLTVGLSPKDQVTKAEVLQAWKIVEGNMSFASASGDAKRFQEMFPDSSIAKKYSQGETKTKYTIQYGILPYFKSKLLEDLSDTPFVFKFDETTNSQVKKQYDGYIMSSVTNKMTTAYVGSLFLGHCNPEDLDHFFEFIKDLNLNTDLLISIGMDGPNVNKSFETSLIAKLEEEKGNSLIPIGSCALHIVNNGFGAGRSDEHRAMFDRCAVLF